MMTGTMAANERRDALADCAAACVLQHLACVGGKRTRGQGLTLAHFSAQPEPVMVIEATAGVHFPAQPEPVF